MRAYRGQEHLIVEITTDEAYQVNILGRTIAPRYLSVFGGIPECGSFDPIGRLGIAPLRAIEHDISPQLAIVEGRLSCEDVPLRALMDPGEDLKLFLPGSFFFDKHGEVDRKQAIIDRACIETSVDPARLEILVPTLGICVIREIVATTMSRTAG